MKKILSIALLFLAVFSVSAQLPSVQLKDINGKVVDTAKLSNDGNPFVISFFATWCKPCLRELSAINEVYADWQEETGMKLIAISTDEGQKAMEVKPLVDSKGFEYEVLLDSSQEFQHALGVQMIPYVMIIDGNGNIVETRNGYTEGSEQHIIDKIKELKLAQ